MCVCLLHVYIKYIDYEVNIIASADIFDLKSPTIVYFLNCVYAPSGLEGAVIADGRYCCGNFLDRYTFQVFEGNTDSYSAKYSYLDEPIFARFVRFHTVQWNRHPSMRVELIGCQGRYILTT